MIFLKNFSEYFVTVDRHMTKYRDDRIVVCGPAEFMGREVANDK